jgi:hypothetical protein
MGALEEAVESDISADEILELLTEYGTEANFYTDTPSFDPETSLTTHAGIAVHTVSVVEENRTYEIPFNADMAIHFSPSGLLFTPRIEQKVSYKGQHWRIVWVKPTEYKGMTLLWTAYLKGVS